MIIFKFICAHHVVYGLLVLKLISDSEDGLEDTSLPPGVTQEDFDLFRQAQERAQDLLTKVCSMFHLIYLAAVLKYPVVQSKTPIAQSFQLIVVLLLNHTDVKI